MIIDISDSAFKRIMNDERLFLPARWDGVDFSATLEKLFNYYIHHLENTINTHKGIIPNIRCDIEKIKRVTGLLIKTTNHYLNGFPAKAFDTFNRVMKTLSQAPLKVYQKSVFEYFETQMENNQDESKLFRAARVEDNKPYERIRVFHTPYNMRSKVSTNRYSIAGYPSLYLGTSLDLCCSEIKANPQNSLTLAAAFKLERSIEYTNTNIQVIELALKPQDFILDYNRNESIIRRAIPSNLTHSNEIRSAFLLWYPLIAGCSFIRTNKSDPFAAEYILPQLLMQWVRSELISDNQNDYESLIGIRYFSCASMKASDMGFNYVFPTSGQQKSANLPYCSVLAKAFRLTSPVFIHEYESILKCEDELIQRKDFDFIDT